MARKIISAKKSKSKSKSKSKPKPKQEITIAPRLRLEPRLKPSPSKKKKNSQNNENEKSIFLDMASIPALDMSTQDSDVNESCEQRNESLNTRTVSAVNGNTSYQAENNTLETSENEERDEPLCKTPAKTAQKRMQQSHRIFHGSEWNDRERMDLAIALQVHGSSDIKKLAECVKTKKEHEIELFMKKRRNEATFNSEVKKINRQGNKFNTLHQHHVATWPNIRKWRRFAFSQMMRYTRTKDYSKPVLSAVCKKFYEEELEPTDPQVINVKLIYKYMMCCLEGELPPLLPPKETALVLDLLREVRLMPIAYDFEEERKFLQDFRTATKFRPFEVKDEFKKQIKKETQEEDLFPSNTVKVPEQVFMELSRHKRLTQCFSPLVTPVWMLQKEQETLAKYAYVSNVYVD